MKKLLFILSAVLLAAGCSTVKPSKSPTPTIDIQKPQNQANEESVSQNATLPLPLGAEAEYKEVFENVSQKCGNQVSLHYVLISLNPNAETHPHSYFFTPGSCGQPDQSLSVIYETTTRALNPTWNMFANKDGALRPIPLQNWKVTYSQALNYALQYGGQDFMNNNPGSAAWTAELENRKGAEFRWAIRYRSNNNPSAPQLKIFIDPSDGKLLGKE